MANRPPRTPPPITSASTRAGSAVYTAADLSQIQSMVDTLNEINQNWERQASLIRDVSGQADAMNDIYDAIIESQNEQIDNLIAQGNTAEEIRDSLLNQRNELDKIVNIEKERQMIMSGANKIQSEINEKMNKSYSMAQEFKKIGMNAFLPDSLKVYGKMLDNISMKFGRLASARQEQMEREIENLRTKGDVEQATMLELMNTTRYKIFETFEDIFGFLSKTILPNILGKIKDFFSSIIEYAKKAIDIIAQIPEKLFEIGKASLMVTKLTIQHFLDLTKALTAVPLNILEKANEIGYEIKKETAEFAQNLENIQKDFRGSSAIGQAIENLQGKLIAQRKEFNDVTTESVALFGRGIAGINKALQESNEIVKSLGTFSSIFAENITKNTSNAFFYYKMKQALNATDEDMQYLARRALTAGKSIATVYENIQNSINDAADAHHLDSKFITKDYLDMRKNIVDFGHITDRQLGGVIGRIKQMGVEMKDANAIFGKIQTFEDAANMASQLSQSFNMVIDSMELLRAETPDQIFKMLRESMFATGRSFNDLNRFEKSLLQQQLGVSAETMQVLFDYRNINKSYQQIIEENKEKDPVDQQIEAINKLKDTIVEFKEVMPKFQNSFDAFFTGLKDNILISSDLRKNLEGVSLSFDGLYNFASKSDLSPFSDLLGTIGKKIEAIKNVLSGENFQNSLESVTKSISNIINVLFNYASGDTSSTQTLTEAIKNIITRITPIFESALDIGSELVFSIIKGFIEALPELSDVIFEKFNDLFDKDKGKIGGLLTSVKGVVDNIISQFGKSDFQGTILGALKTAFSFTGEVVKVVGEFAKRISKEIIKDLAKGFTPSSGSIILTSIKDLLAGIKTIFIGEFNSSTKKMEYTGLIPQLLGLDNNGKPTFTLDKVKDFIKNTFVPLFTDITYELVTVVDDFTVHLMDMLNSAANDSKFFDNLFTGSKVSEIFTKISSIFTNIFFGTSGKKSIVDSVFKLLDMFIEYFNKNSGGISNAFQKILGGITQYYITYYKFLFDQLLKNFGKEIAIGLGAVFAGFLAYFAVKSAVLGTVITASFTTGAAIASTAIVQAMTTGSLIASRNIATAAATSQIGGVGALGPALKTGAKFLGYAGAGYLAGQGVKGAFGDDPNTKRQGTDYAAAALTGAGLGAMFGPIGAAVGAAGGLAYAHFIDDGFISKDGKLIKIHDDDNILAFKEGGPVMEKSGNMSINKIHNEGIGEITKQISMLTSSIGLMMNKKDSINPELIKSAVKEAIIEGFKAQNQVIEVKLNGEKVGEGLLASGFTNMMSNANKTKGNPTINPGSIIYRDGQMPSSGYNT